MDSSTILGVLVLVVIGIAVWFAYKWGRSEQKRVMAEAASKKARRRHAINEDVYRMSDDDLDKRLRKLQ